VGPRGALDVSEKIIFRVSGNERQIAQTEAQILCRLSSPGRTTQMQHKCNTNATQVHETKHNNNNNNNNTHNLAKTITDKTYTKNWRMKYVLCGSKTQLK